MAEAAELERLKQVKSYFERYYQFEDAVTVNQQNKEYLKTYIRNQYDVEAEFNYKEKLLKSIRPALIIGVIAGLFLFAISSWIWWIGLITFVLITAGYMVLSAFVLKYRLDDAIQRQREVNEGITEQISVLEGRDEQLIRQRDDYYRGLKKRVDFMSLDYMDNIDQIQEILENGEADTCEDAVAVFEQKMIFQEMNSFLAAPAVQEVKPLDREAAKEKFGDPLEVIRQNRKKRKKEKNADSIFSAF